MIDESTEFIVCDEGDFVKSVDSSSGDIEYTRDREAAQRFHGREWVEFWRGVPGVLLEYLGPSPAQEMAAVGAARLPGME